MQGTSKRKRSLSDSETDIENMPIAEAKRLRQENGSDETEPANDERLPLAELPVESRLVRVRESDDDGSDLEWLGESMTELPDSSDEEPESWQKDVEEAKSPKSDPPSLPSSPSSNGLVKLFFESREHFFSKIDLINFFKRKECSSSGERSEDLFNNNPGLTPRMRSVLLEWIVEVCDVYKLHRETYHLTVDYLDRYLCKSTSIAKNQLQLIGVTALFIASKYEEIYPPKLSDFAYITDGACSEKDILTMENLMVHVLDWRCTVNTSSSWLLGFLQLLYFQENKDSASVDVTKQLYSHRIFSTVAHLLDLCSLDCNFIVFPYKVLALASLHTVLLRPDPIILKVSGFDFEDLSRCMHWMKPFWKVLCDKFSYEQITSITYKTGEPRPSDFAHMKMKHNIDLDMLETAQKSAEEDIPELLLTPPQSSEKTKERINPVGSLEPRTRD